MKGLFVTGTDTEVGKTVVTGLLARFWQDRGLKVVTQKWIQSGCRSLPADIAVHRRLMGPSSPAAGEPLDRLCPYRLSLPASAHLAAEQDGVTLQRRRVVQAYRELVDRYDRVLVEGLGGWMVPVNRREVLADWVRFLGLPVLIVVRNRLGAINHSLLTIEAVRRCGLPVVGLLFNAATDPDDPICRDNPVVVGQVGQVPVLGTLPFQDDPARLQAAFTPIGRAIDEAFRRIQVDS